MTNKNPPTPPTFRLDQTPCIYAVTTFGLELVSLRDVLKRAHIIQDIHCENALGRVVLYRLLTALVIDIFPCANEGEWDSLWEAGKFNPEAIDAYFDAHKDRFDLFSETSPFLQTAGLESTTGDTKLAQALLSHIANGNNVPHFSVGSEGQLLPMRPHEAFEALLICIGFDTAAIKTGAKGDPAVKGGKTTGNKTGHAGSLGVLIPLGETLFDTLMINNIIRAQKPDDAPVWRRPPQTPEWTERATTGILDQLTFPSRRIRLIPETNEAGEVVVSRVVISAGDRLATFTREHEPHTMWRKNKDGRLLPQRLKSTQFNFPALPALLTTIEGTPAHRSVLQEHLSQLNLQATNYPLRALLVSVEYGNQSAVVENVVADEMPVPLAALLSEDSDANVTVREIGRTAEEAARMLNNLDANLRRSVSAEPLDWKSAQRIDTYLYSTMRNHALKAFSALSTSPDEAQNVLHQWEQSLYIEARKLGEQRLRSVPLAAYRGSESNSNSMNASRSEGIFFGMLAKLLPEAHQHHFASSQKMKEER